MATYTLVKGTEEGVRASILTAYGGVFKVAKIIAPTEVGDNEVIIAVKSSSVNPVDFKMRSGMMKMMLSRKFPKISGYDLSGVITKVGSKVQNLQVGDEVYGATGINGGAFAEIVKYPANLIAKKAKNQNWNEAASVPIVGLTAHDCIFRLGNLSAGQKILILGGGSAVGMFAIQFAKIVGAKIWTTCSSEKSELIKSLGADVTIDYKNQDIIQALGEEKMDIVVDAVGTKEDRNKSFSVVKKNGAVITTNPVELKTTSIPYTSVLVDVVWKKVSNKLSNGVSYKILQLDEKVYNKKLDQIARWIEEGKVKTVIDSVYPLEQIEEAAQKCESGTARGKVVIEISK